MPQKLAYKDHFLIRTDKNPNTAGAMIILELAETQGLLPGHGLDATKKIIEKAQNAEIDLLYVFGHNLVDIFGRDTVEKIAKKVKLFVFQGSNLNDTCAYAHVILPSSVYAEKDGTFTNCQHRVQRILPAFPPLGESKGDWEIMSILSQKLGVGFSYKNSEEVFNALTQSVPLFEMTYQTIGDQGMLVRNKNVCLI